MFAIIQTGGKQYRVKQGSLIDVELLGVDDNTVVEFDVLFVDEDGEDGEKHIGAPVLENFKVKGEVLSVVYGPKVEAFKYNRRKGYHRSVGHRQRYSRVRIDEIAKAA